MKVVGPAEVTADTIYDYMYAVSLPVSQDSLLSTADEAPWRCAAQLRRLLLT